MCHHPKAVDKGYLSTMLNYTQYRYLVYRFVDPRTDTTIYVGISRNIVNRYRNHISMARTYSQMKRAGLRPEHNLYAVMSNLIYFGMEAKFEILESTFGTEEQAKIAEAKWMIYYKSKGHQLQNVYPKPICKPETKGGE